MLKCIYIFCFYVLFHATLTASLPRHKNELYNIKTTFKEMYKLGIDAYLENRWYDCIMYIKKALDLRERSKTILVDCRQFCNTNSNEQASKQPDQFLNNKYSFEFQHTLLKFYLKTSLCLMRCHRSYFGNSTFLDPYEKEYDEAQPYNYLQLCYFKVGDIDKAASCAFSFLTLRPDHEVMQSNLKFYLSHPDVVLTNVLNYLNSPFVEHYIKGAKYYSENKFSKVVKEIEVALNLYYEAEDRCRYLCEGSYTDIHYDQELVIAITDHYTFSLRCKLKCAAKLSSIDGEPQEDLLASFFHYLQFAYHKIGHMRKACEAVATYQLLKKDDQVMENNRAYYASLEGVQTEWFTTREEIQEYVARNKQEEKLLTFIEKEFTSLASDEENNYEEQLKSEEAEKTSPQWLSSGEVMKRDSELNGTNRFVADNVVPASNCDDLIQLANEGAIHGDGYDGKNSPHTSHELFEGLTMGRAAMLFKKGILKYSSVQQFLDISERVKEFVAETFELKSQLYFSYTHLVCRTSMTDGDGEERTDLSHPIHADNCLLTNEGECLKQRPAYTWRDYSAILYLNDNFEGGEFLFAQDKTNIQASIKPKCGRVIGFSAGKENLHGVSAITKGRRCALALWFTQDDSHQELEREFAAQILSSNPRKEDFLKVLKHHEEL